MALKDWKKIENKITGTCKWVNKNIWPQLYLTRENNLKKRKMQWTIEIFSNYQHPPIFKDYFKTKLQALKFAKVYMIKH